VCFAFIIDLSIINSTNAHHTISFKMLYILLFLECDTLSTPLNGWYNVSGGINDQLTPGSVAQFSCNQGYVLIGVNATTCDASLTWTDTTPICVVKSGGKMSMFSNSTIFFVFVR